MTCNFHLELLISLFFIEFILNSKENVFKTFVITAHCRSSNNCCYRSDKIKRPLRTTIGVLTVTGSTAMVAGTLLEFMIFGIPKEF